MIRCIFGIGYNIDEDFLAVTFENSRACVHYAFRGGNGSHRFTHDGIVDG
ncbi:MAG: hypothetical protein IKK82_02490 [Kiritimatiellae bacterium]|nr:hypothetical protein [Kiritimatiellia bacterium]